MLYSMNGDGTEFALWKWKAVRCNDKADGGIGMDNFWIIYKYEMKKLTGKKLLWGTAFLCMIAIVFTACAGLIGTYYVGGEAIESNYEAFRKDRIYRKNLSGRYIDEALLQETVDAYCHIPTDEPRYTLTEEYETFARPYSDIFNMIRAWTGMDFSSIQEWNLDEAALYEAREQQRESHWQSLLLTETEKEFWRGMESQIDTPLIYYYHEGYENLLNCFLTVGVLLLLFVAICLSNLFADEHIRRTDQLVLSSRGGKESAYWAKILAGVTASVVAATLMAIMTLVLNLVIYGAEGFEMPLQCCLYVYSYPITIGQACIIAYGILIVASILAAVFVMVISELFRSGIVALAISTGLIILGNLVLIPAEYRVLAQMWDWTPMAYLAPWNIFDARTLTVFGQCFASWQTVPIIYILLSVILAVGGKYIYQRYQVSGR